MKFAKQWFAVIGLAAMLAATSAQAAENPCAGKEGMKANPCAMNGKKEMKRHHMANPCAMKKGIHHKKGANPYAGKNPCAMKK